MLKFAYFKKKFFKILAIFKRFAQVYFLRHGFLWHDTGTAAYFFDERHVGMARAGPQATLMISTKKLEKDHYHNSKLLAIDQKKQSMEKLP